MDLKCKVGDKVKLEDNRVGTITYEHWFLGYLTGYEVQINKNREPIFADEVKEIL